MTAMDYIAFARMVTETALGKCLCACGHDLMSHNLVREWCDRTGCACLDFAERQS